MTEPIASASSECPICGVNSPHWHHPQIREIVQLIASFETGAMPHSPFNDMWLDKPVYRDRIAKLADKIVTLIQAKAQERNDG